MKHIFIYITSLSLLFISCNSTEASDTENETTSKEPTIQEEVKEEEALIEPHIADYNWLNFEYDSVVAYQLESEGFGAQVLEEGVLSSHILEEFTHTMTVSEVIQLNNTLSSLIPNQESAECFEPHHGVVFYLEDSIVGHTSICFMCNNYLTEPPTMNKFIDISELHPLFEKMGFSFY